MREVSLVELNGQLLSVLRKAFEGPGQAWSYFTDNNPETERSAPWPTPRIISVPFGRK